VSAPGATRTGWPADVARRLLATLAPPGGVPPGVKAPGVKAPGVKGPDAKAPNAKAPGTEAPQSLAAVWASAPFAVAGAVTEHLLGVLPLLDFWECRSSPTLAAVRDGALPTALGLFTPNSRLTMAIPAVAARWSGGHAVLDGRLRFGFEAARASVVTGGFDDGLRLCLLVHDAPGVRIGAAGQAPGSGWADLTGAIVDADLVSRPVSWDRAGPLARAVDGYAWAYADNAARHAARVVADLRRTLAATPTSAEVLSTAQFLAHELTRLEIELSLLATAAGFGPGFRGEAPGGEAVAAVLTACTDLTYRTACIAEDFATELGLAPLHGGDPSWSAATIQAHFGGRRMVAAELGRRMGLLAGLH
jgi:hypothetical protein